MPAQGFEPTIKKVHEDARGELYSILLPDNRELILLHSVKGTLRGGHSHSVPEQVMVLSGKMRYHKLTAAGKDHVVTLEAGDCSWNAPGQVHMGEFLESSWIIELKLARIGEWDQQNYPEWRKRVEANAGR